MQQTSFKTKPAENKYTNDKNRNIPLNHIWKCRAPSKSLKRSLKTNFFLYSTWYS